jgi:hypothetical protein
MWDNAGMLMLLLFDLNLPGGAFDPALAEPAGSLQPIMDQARM